MRVLIAAIVVGLHAPVAEVCADPTHDAALVHLDRGVAAFRAGDFQRAQRELQAAHELAPDKPNPYRWLALTEIQLGDCTSALVHIDGFLTRVGGDDPRIAEMTRWQAFCRRSLEPRAKPASTSSAREVRPLRQRWWFWPTVGAAAVAMTGAIVYVATDTEHALLPPIRCGATGCRP